MHELEKNLFLSLDKVSDAKTEQRTLLNLPIQNEKKKSSIETINIYSLTSGYIRELETSYSFQYKLPTQMIKLISDYYPRDFKFKNNLSLNDLKISNDGLSVSTTAGLYISVQFGDFFTNKIKYVFIQ